MCIGGLMRSLIAILLALAAAAGAGWYYYSGAFAPMLTLVEVRRGTAAEIVYATGVVEPLRWAKVVALQRKRIEWICDCEGKAVSKGDVLVRLDDGEERAALNELEARRRRIALDVERIRGLVARNAATQTSLDQTLTQLLEFDARIEAQKDRIGDLQLRSPLDGAVLRRDGEIGEVAGAGTNDVLLWVGPPKPLRIVADVSEDDIVRVRAGQKVLLRNEGLGGAGIAALVGDMTPKGDPATRTFRVYMPLPDDTPLRIGMTVEANIVTREKENVLLAPAEAILNGAVFTVESGRLKRKPVASGIRGTRYVEITQGLSEGDRIVTPATASMRDGAQSRVAPPASDAPK